MGDPGVSIKQCADKLRLVCQWVNDVLGHLDNSNDRRLGLGYEVAMLTAIRELLPQNEVEQDILESARKLPLAQVAQVLCAMERMGTTGGAADIAYVAEIMGLAAKNRLKFQVMVFEVEGLAMSDGKVQELEVLLGIARVPANGYHKEHTLAALVNLLKARFAKNA